MLETMRSMSMGMTALTVLLAAQTCVLDQCQDDCKLETLHPALSAELPPDSTGSVDAVTCNTCQHSEFTIEWALQPGPGPVGNVIVGVFATCPGTGQTTQGVEKSVDVTALEATLDYNVKSPCGENVEVNYHGTVQNASNLVLTNVTTNVKCARFEGAAAASAVGPSSINRSR